MKIKDYKCKCGHNDFFFADKGSQKGIYCSYCGKWLKWADKDEQNLTLNQEPQSFNWCTDCKEYDQEKHCCHRWSKVIRDTVEEMKQEQESILDKLKADIEQDAFKDVNGSKYIFVNRVNQIIDKYKGESEDKE